MASTQKNPEDCLEHKISLVEINIHAKKHKMAGFMTV